LPPALAEAFTILNIAQGFNLGNAKELLLCCPKNVSQGLNIGLCVEN